MQITRLIVHDLRTLVDCVDELAALIMRSLNIGIIYVFLTSACSSLRPVYNNHGIQSGVD
jgi:hypothetical protein